MTLQRKNGRALGRSFALAARRGRVISVLLRWYRKYGRTLPWRNDRDPYRILLSEVMLQQTQVSRVLTKYPEFLKKFPTLKSVARSRTSDVIKAWRGMGYNNRALRLQTLSKTVADTLGGNLPGSSKELQGLPGIGRYTAHAVACFAFGERVPVVDTNVARVLMRLYPLSKFATNADIWALAENHLPRKSVDSWNQALMDLGATICIAANPKCSVCPLRSFCPSAHKVRRGSRLALKSEPGRDGIPNRIYRGRAIDVLRNLETGKSIATSVLARKVKKDFRVNDRGWFNSLLRSLERDGLVRFRGRSRLSLPD